MLSVVSKLTWFMRNEPLVPNKRESRLSLCLDTLAIFGREVQSC